MIIIMDSDYQSVIKFHYICCAMMHWIELFSFRRYPINSFWMNWFLIAQCDDLIKLNKLYGRNLYLRLYSCSSSILLFYTPALARIGFENFRRFQVECEGFFGSDEFLASEP